MATIVVHTQGMRVDARSKHLRFRPPGPDSTVRDLPLLSVERLLLFGRVELSNRCIHLLAASNCDITWFSRHGRYRARLEGQRSNSVAFRRQQFRCAEQVEWARSMAGTLIAAKIANQRAVLVRANRGSPSTEGIDQVIEKLAAYRQQAEAAPPIDALRGIEGSAARIYFSAWATFCGDAFTWNGRNRRPPKDPLNAALSLGYTLLLAEVDAHCRAVGADPWLGFFHADNAGAPALALDLMEALRPLIVDRLILDMCRHRRLQPKHFRPDGQGMVFSDDAFRRYLIAFEQRMRHGDDEQGGGGRDLLQDQLDGFRQTCLTGQSTAFKPSLLRT